MESRPSQVYSPQQQPIDQAMPAPSPEPKQSFLNQGGPAKFSKMQAAIFALICAVIGAFLLIRTFAAAPLVASMQAETMKASGGTSASAGFITSLTNNGSVTTPSLWTFSPGVDTGAGYFFADGKQLVKITGPGPYVLRLNPGMLTAGTHKLGHAWDTTAGVHQSPANAYTEKIINGSGSGFLTTLRNNITINAPYVWAFDPGTATSAGYFFADGKQLAKITGPGPYAVLLKNGDVTVLAGGAHKLGHAWDTTAGVHQSPTSAYSATYNPGTSPTINSTIISDSHASGGQAVKFGASVTLNGSLNLPSQATSLTVMAHGDQCSGAWPQMNVAVDGHNVLAATVASSSWTAYTVNLTLNAGTHSLAITNASSGICTPSLYADVTNFFGPNIITTPPTVSLSASPTTVSSGQASTLSWKSTNATSCIASGAWTGSEPTSGTASTNALTLNSTYTLTCTGAGGSAIASTTVTVTATTATSYDQAIAYTQTRPAFTPTRTVNISDATSFKNALLNLQPGDLVKATASFSVPGETTISKQLSSPAVIDLGSFVTFVYSSGSNLPAVYLNNPSNLQIYGGNISTADTGGTCLLVHGAQHVLWWGFLIHNCGGSGLAAFPVGGDISNDDFQGEITSIGHNLNWDPHTEKGSGIQGAILWDSDNSNAFSSNRFAIYAHDLATGNCVELGNGASGPASGNILYEKCVNENFVSILQTGGSGLAIWGDGSSLGLDVKYLEVSNAQGRAVDAEGLYSGQSLKGSKVDYGRATNTNLNAQLDQLRLPGVRWDTLGSLNYLDISPTP